MGTDTTKKEATSLVKKERVENAVQVGELLQNPFAHVSPEKRQEFIDKVAEKSLDLEFERAERELKHKAGWKDVHQLVDAHRELSQIPGLSGHKIAGKIDVGSGSVNVEGAKKGCLVSIVVLVGVGTSLVGAIIAWL